MNILSVDWDYFFPNTGSYDWGFREDPMMMEMIWSHRAGSRNILHPERTAVTEMQPCGFENFWSQFKFSAEPLLVITESHKDLYTILDNNVRAETVVNFDAHHDIKYSNNTEVLDCGSWVHHAFKRKLMKKYELVYPVWRKQEPESHDIFKYSMKKVKENTKVHYSIPTDLPKFGAVFICRSSSWSASWGDDKWLEFIYWWQNNKPFSWAVKGACEFVLRKRSPGLAVALQMEKVLIDAQMRARENPSEANKIMMDAFVESSRIAAENHNV